MTIGGRQWLKTRNIAHDSEIRTSLMPDEFARKVKVVHKYAKERRVSCQENSYLQPSRLLPVNGVRMPVSGNGQAPAGHLRPQSDAPSAALLFFFCQNRHVVQIFCLNLYLKGGSINYHRKVFLCQYFYVLSSCGLFLYKTGCASTIQTSLIVFGLLRFWFNLLVRSVV